MPSKTKVNFHIEAQQGKARAGYFTLNGHKVLTPAFMPVGTKATIKGMILDMLQDPKYVGDVPLINLILANTYHLYLRPGTEIIQQHGWLHRFEHRDGLILTDSGGFQIFSLGLSRKQHKDSSLRTQGQSKKLFKIMKEWVRFRSIHDGSKHFRTPPDCVDVQCALWSDIMMMLDVCSPPWVTEKKFRQHLRLTHHRAKQQYDHHQSRYDRVRGVLWPIVQGGTNLDLRTQSAQELSNYAPDGIAIGWVSVGETQEQIQRVVAHTTPLLPPKIPRYLMGVGNPDGIRFAINQGIDLFDCVLPTRLGRHGVFYSDEGEQKIWHAKHKHSLDPLTRTCDCFACRTFTKAYLHHLFREKEMLGATLLSLHNIVYLHTMVTQMRNDILLYGNTE